MGHLLRGINYDSRLTQKEIMLGALAHALRPGGEKESGFQHQVGKKLTAELITRTVQRLAKAKSAKGSSFVTLSSGSLCDHLEPEVREQLVLLASDATRTTLEEELNDVSSIY